MKPELNWGLYKVDFAYSDGEDGSKIRPVLNFFIDEKFNHCVKITTTNRFDKTSGGKSFCAPLFKWAEAGLSVPSFAECNETRKLKDVELIEFIGQLHKRDRTAVKAKLKDFNHLTFK